VIKIDQLRKYMKTLYEKDKKNKTIHAKGKTLDDALREAAIQLGLPIKKIEYEIIKRGTKKVLGMGGGEWELVAYAAAEDLDAKDIFEEEIAFDMNLKSEYLEKAKNKDGKISVRLQPDGVFLKVNKPIGSGKKEISQVMTKRLSIKLYAMQTISMLKLPILNTIPVKIPFFR